jgi:ABC-type polysaccharide/polyol phosphate transport system ATPase subunit
VVAIRIRGLSRYFGPRVEIDGAERPREAWQTLLRIAGIGTSVASEDGVQRTVGGVGYVLKDISFDVEAGSVVCLAGATGSGKSVLLQILAGAIPPTSGSVELYGAVSSLLAVGDNLDDQLTGDENIRTSPFFENASPEEAARFAAEVIDFAELHGFEHSAVRTYSTGMTLRLSIALALSGQPSIVLIDDVLGVGDIAFQQKCIDRLYALKRAGSTLLLAFSDEELVHALATRIITLGGGHLVGDTPPRHLAAGRHASQAADVEWRVVRNLPEDDLLALRSLSLAAERDGNETFVNLAMTVEAKRGGFDCRPSLFLMSGKTVVYRSLFPRFLEVTAPTRLAFSVRVPTHVLPNGDYTLTISIQALDGGLVYSMKAHEAVALTVRRAAVTGEGEQPEAAGTATLVVSFPWEIEALTEAGA